MSDTRASGEGEGRPVLEAGSEVRPVLEPGGEKRPVLEPGGDEPRIAVLEERAVELQADLAGVSAQNGRLAGTLLEARDQIERTGDIVVEYGQIGGLDKEIQRIRNAIELPYLHPGLFQRPTRRPRARSCRGTSGPMCPSTPGISPYTAERLRPPCTT